MLAKGLQRKYSRGRYRAWLARKGIRRRIRKFHEKARNVVEDWARKAAKQMVEAVLKHGYAAAREDLTGLIKALRRLPKSAEQL